MKKYSIQFFLVLMFVALPLAFQNCAKGGSESIQGSNSGAAITTSSGPTNNIPGTGPAKAGGDPYTGTDFVGGYYASVNELCENGSYANVVYVLLSNSDASIVQLRQNCQSVMNNVDRSQMTVLHTSGGVIDMFKFQGVIYEPGDIDMATK